jgi:hypothetical protein
MFGELSVIIEQLAIFFTLHLLFSTVLAAGSHDHYR